MSSGETETNGPSGLPGSAENAGAPGSLGSAAGSLGPAQNSGAKKSSGLRSAVVLGALLLIVGLVIFFRSSSSEVAASLRPASVPQEDFDQAAEEFRKFFRRDATDADTVMWIAETAVRKDQIDRALDCFASIPSSHERYGPKARIEEAKLMLKRNQVARAEASLRESLQLLSDPSHKGTEQLRTARQLLVNVLTVELRFEDRKEILRQMVRDADFDVIDAKQFYFPSLLIWKSPQTSQRLNDFLKEDPSNPHLLIAQARHLLAEGNAGDAEKILDALQQKDPSDPRVIAARLECFFEQNRWEDFGQLLATAPEYQSSEPWMLTHMRAEFALHSQDLATAEKYFRHVLTADRTNATCHMSLAKVLNDLGQIEERTLIQNRAMTLARMRVVLPAADNRTPGAVRAVAAAAKSLEMDDAARNFEQLASRLSSQPR